VNLQAVRLWQDAASTVPSRVRQDAGRDEILDAAAAAFLERGYAATSIDDVADRLGCTKGRVYHHFRTKGGLFLGVHQRAFRSAIDAVRPIVRSRAPASERLHKMAYTHARLTLEAGQVGPAVRDTEMALVSEGRPPSQGLLDVSELRKQYEDCFVTVIAQGVKSSEFRRVDAHLMAKASLGALNRLGESRTARNQLSRAESDDIAAEFATFVTRGLTRQGGIAAHAGTAELARRAVG
jgi:AcrR family transcriptional regulator